VTEFRRALAGAARHAPDQEMAALLKKPPSNGSAS
jgi:hypothetical protein